MECDDDNEDNEDDIIIKRNLALIAEKKKDIQTKIKEELNILVDAPEQGTGNTNNGNVARKFFNNVETIARITGKKKKIYS